MNVIKGGHSGRGLMFCQILFVPGQLAGSQLRDRERDTFLYVGFLAKRKQFVKNANGRYVIDNYDNLEFLINTRAESCFLSQ